MITSEIIKEAMKTFGGVCPFDSDDCPGGECVMGCMTLKKCNQCECSKKYREKLERQNGL